MPWHRSASAPSPDAVSAAVRLNLLGPAAGQVTLQWAQASAEVGMQRVARAMSDTDDDPVTAAKAAAAGCAPVLEAVHPCHDLLATRLFRT